MTCSVLPVSWLAFDAEKTENGNLLTWEIDHYSSQSEIVIQRKDEYGDFAALGSVSVTKRRWLDEDAPAGMATYRLVAIGQDGRSATSPTLDIYRAQDFAVEVYSNPVQLPSPLAIKLVLNETSMIKATLSDPQGRIVSQVRETFFAGEHQLKLPTAKLAAGSYVLSVSGGESQVVKRVMLY